MATDNVVEDSQYTTSRFLYIGVDASGQQATDQPVTETNSSGKTETNSVAEILGIPKQGLKTL